MHDVRSTRGFRHRYVAASRRVAGLVVMLAVAWVNCSFAQRPLPAVVGADGFLSLSQRISIQGLQGLRATAVDPSADDAFEVDVQGDTLIVKHLNTEIARGSLSESETTRETCYGFENDNGRLKLGYAFCQPRADMVVTARPKAKDGYFASLKAGSLYFKFTLLDRNYGANETVYSAAMLKPRK
jgi:hypothetical protein